MIAQEQLVAKAQDFGPTCELLDGRVLKRLKAGTIARILNVAQHVDSVERTNRKMGEQVEDFHASQQPPSAEEEAAIVVQTADGKGIPIRRPADAPRIQDHQRRSGPKPDRKKMATVASVYTVDLFIRTPEEVVDSLFRDPRAKEQAEKSRRKRPQSLTCSTCPLGSGTPPGCFAPPTRRPSNSSESV